MKKKIILILFLCFLNLEYCFAQDLSWILDCSYNPDKVDFSYFEAIDNLKNSGISRTAVSQEMLKRLPDIHLGRNNECIYEAILYFGDESIISYFKKRSENHDDSIDRPGYSSDLYQLLLLRGVYLKTENDFKDHIEKLKRPISIIYLLDMHCKKLPIISRLSLFLWLDQSNIIDGVYSYYLSDFIEDAYKESPEDFLKYLNGLEDHPFILTCVINDSCP